MPLRKTAASDWAMGLATQPAMRKHMRMQHETNTSKIKARLEREGWELVGGTKHDKYRKAGLASIMVPRHRSVTPGVAQSIARAAGWIK